MIQYNVWLCVYVYMNKYLYICVFGYENLNFFNVNFEKKGFRCRCILVFLNRNLIKI